MNQLEKIAENINIISEFLSKRDIKALNKEALKERYGIEQVDLLILFGASIIHGCKLAAQAYKEGIAKRMMIVGGEGHTTNTLRKMIHSKYPEYDTRNESESEMIAYFMQQEYNITDCLLEKYSTNCGNNVSNALEVVNELALNPKYVLIMQDSSMQMRMDAGFKKIWTKDVKVINFASYRAKIMVKDEQISFEQNEIEGLWDIQHYIDLQMGEIPRLSDTKEGYGPKGKNYIAHVDIPSQVELAFEYLKNYYHTREANEKYK